MDDGDGAAAAAAADDDDDDDDDDAAATAAADDDIIMIINVSESIMMTSFPMIRWCIDLRSQHRSGWMESSACLQGLRGAT